jgi:hypothetical protein
MADSQETNQVGTSKLPINIDISSSETRKAGTAEPVTPKRSWTEPSRLILGWRLARDLGTEWFDKGGNRSHGDQPPNMLEGISAASIAMHTAIIAKSGSGKSFFLGRYLEEVLLKTDATVTIFDPNADFRKFSEVEPCVWQKHENGKVKDVAWNPCAKSRPPLPHEKEMKEFSEPWAKVKIRVLGGADPSLSTSTIMEEMKFSWKGLSSHLLLVADRGRDEIEPADFATLHVYVGAIDDLYELYSVGLSEKQRGEVKRLSVADCMTSTVVGDSEKTRRAISHIISDAKSECEKIAGAAENFVEPESNREQSTKEKFQAAFRNAALVKKETKEHYQRIHRVLEQRGRISGVSDPLGLADRSFRARVIDMPSFRDREDRDMSVLLALDAVWEDARGEWERATNNEEVNESRRPHLIVIDEAHNLIPADTPLSPVRAEIRERIKTIAGEGRKYGLFLVIVTQRPDKVDPQVLGECGNQAIMLVPSLTIIQECRERMGLLITEDEAGMIMNKFGKGYVWLSGTWSPNGPTVTFAAARRTKAGGADLPKGWMVPRKEVADVFRTLEMSKSVSQS